MPSTPQEQYNADRVLWGMIWIAVAMFVADVVYQLIHLP